MDECDCYNFCQNETYAWSKELEPSVLMRNLCKAFFKTNHQAMVGACTWVFYVLCLNRKI